MKKLVVYFKNDINAGSMEKLRKAILRFIRKFPKGKVVLLIESEGGDEDTVFSFAGLVRLLGIELTTVIIDEVRSAASLLFLTGQERLVSCFSGLAFHRSYLYGVFHEKHDGEEEDMDHIGLKKWRNELREKFAEIDAHEQHLIYQNKRVRMFIKDVINKPDSDIEHLFSEDDHFYFMLAEEALSLGIATGDISDLNLGNDYDFLIIENTPALKKCKHDDNKGKEE